MNHAQFSKEPPNWNHPKADDREKKRFISNYLQKLVESELNRNRAHKWNYFEL
jgi:hypothetical protein